MFPILVLDLALYHGAIFFPCDDDRQGRNRK